MIPICNHVKSQLLYQWVLPPFLLIINHLGVCHKLIYVFENRPPNSKK